MAHRFRGTSTNKVDGKGRVMIPADFRRVLELCDPTRDPSAPATVNMAWSKDDPALTVWTAEALADIDDQIDAMEYDNPDRPAAIQYFYKNMHTIQIDDAGRIVLPKSLREHAGITTEAVFAAEGRNFTIAASDAPGAEADPLTERMALRPKGASVLALLKPLPAVADAE